MNRPIDPSGPSFEYLKEESISLPTRLRHGDRITFDKADGVFALYVLRATRNNKPLLWVDRRGTVVPEMSISCTCEDALTLLSVGSGLAYIQVTEDSTDRSFVFEFTAV